MIAVAIADVHAEPRDQGYVEVGAMAGIGSRGTPLYAGIATAAVEGGVHWVDAWWLRGLVGYSVGADFEDTGDATIFQARAGLEHRSCNESGNTCFLWMLDVGLQRARWEGFDSAIEDDGTATGVILVPKLAVDLGGSVRVRFGLEVSPGVFYRSAGGRHYWTGGLNAIDLTLGLAYQW